MCIFKVTQQLRIRDFVCVCELLGVGMPVKRGGGVVVVKELGLFIRNDS